MLVAMDVSITTFVVMVAEIVTRQVDRCNSCNMVISYVIAINVQMVTFQVNDSVDFCTPIQAYGMAFEGDLVQANSTQIIQLTQKMLGKGERSW